jgi:hypothetical protein
VVTADGVLLDSELLDDSAPLVGALVEVVEVSVSVPVEAPDVPVAVDSVLEEAAL